LFYAVIPAEAGIQEKEAIDERLTELLRAWFNA